MAKPESKVPETDKVGAARPAGAATSPRPGEGPPEKSAQDILRENLPLVVVVLVIAVLAPVAWTYRGRQARQENEAAWTALGELKRSSPEGTEGFAELFEKHRGTTAAPYVKITWASRLYETGEKANLEQALELYREVLRDHKDVELIRRVLPEQIAKIEAELKDPRVPWDKTGKPADPEESAPFAPVPPTGEGADDHSGHDHAPGEHPQPADDHSGHDHAPGEHPPPAAAAEGAAPDAAPTGEAPPASDDAAPDAAPTGEAPPASDDAAPDSQQD